MTQTHFIEYRGHGFWAYDVAQGVFLKFLIDCAEAHCRSSADGCPWLAEVAARWRAEACGIDNAMTIDESWSQQQIGVFLALADEACRQIEMRGSIPAHEAESWELHNKMRFFTRGATEIHAKPVVELGRAVIALVEGRLAPPPTNNAWLFGSPDERHKTIRMIDGWEGNLRRMQ